MTNLETNDKQARTAILGRIRHGLDHLTRFPAAPQAHTPPASELPPDREALLQSFAVELTNLRGIFHRCARAALAGLVGDLIAEAGGKEPPGILAWAEAALPPEAAGLLDALQAGGVRVIDGGVPFDAPDREPRLAEMERAVAGLTGVEAALADIGGVVVRSGAGRGRLASLLPPTHIALVSPDQFQRSLYDWMESLRQAGRLEATFTEASNLTVITGPSRTADIEKTLVLGVHGPKTLHVVCVEAE